MTYVSKNIDVDIEIDSEDVINYINNCQSRRALEEIAEAMSKRHVSADMTSLDAATVQFLLDRLQNFGLEDMLDLLKREGWAIGIHITGEKA